MGILADMLNDFDLVDGGYTESHLNGVTFFKSSKDIPMRACQINCLLYSPVSSLVNELNDFICIPR